MFINTLYLFSMFVFNRAKQQKDASRCFTYKLWGNGVLIELVHTKSACSTTSIVGGEAVIRGCGLCAWCACKLLYFFPIVQTHAYRLTHALQCILYRECSSVNHHQSLVIQLIRNSICADTEKVQGEHLDFGASKNRQRQLQKTVPTYIKNNPKATQTPSYKIQNIGGEEG